MNLLKALAFSVCRFAQGLRDLVERAERRMPKLERPCVNSQPTNGGPVQQPLTEAAPTMIICVSLLLACTALVSVSRAGQEDERFTSLIAKWKERRPTSTAASRTSNAKTVEEEYDDHYIQYQETNTQVTKRLKEQVLHDNAASAVYPGGLIWTQPLLEGEITALRALNGRPPVRVSFTGASGTKSFQHNGSQADFRENYESQIAGISGVTPIISYRLHIGEDFASTLLEAGLSARYWGAKLSAGFRKSVSSTQSFAVVVIDQVYYSLSVDAPPPGGFAPVSVLAASDGAAEYATMMEKKGEIGYVRRATYGRRLVIGIDANGTQEQVKRSLNFSYNSGVGSVEGSVSDEDRQTWSSMSLNAVVIGGSLPPDATANLLTGPRHQFIESLNDFLRATLGYGQGTSGALVSFEVAYDSDDALVASFESADYSGRDAGRRLMKAGVVRVSDVLVSTSGGHGYVKSGDTDLGTDDWTKVTMSYALRPTSDRRSVEARFSWDALEGNRRKECPKDTHIRSVKDWHVIWRVPVDDRRLIARMEDASSAKNDGEWIAGKLHSEFPFPKSVGSMKGIMLTVDGRGDDDHKRQKMTARLDLAVYMDRER